MKDKHNWLGKVITTDKDETFTVVDYQGFNSVYVYCRETSTIYKTSVTHLNKKSISTPFARTVYGVGYFGIGNFECRGLDGKITPEYCAWANMLKRCYNPTNNKDQSWYAECLVEDSWHDFQTFAAWYVREISAYAGTNVRPYLDKDLSAFRKGYLYSEDTCVILPQEINSNLEKKNVGRLLPEGVSLKKGKFQVQMSKHNKTYSLGFYSTQAEAEKKYKEAKIKHIRELADKYQSVLSLKAKQLLQIYLENYENTD